MHASASGLLDHGAHLKCRRLVFDEVEKSELEDSRSTGLESNPAMQSFNKFSSVFLSLYFHNSLYHASPYCRSTYNLAVSGNAGQSSVEYFSYFKYRANQLY